MCRPTGGGGALRVARGDEARHEAAVGSERLASNGVKAAATGAALVALLGEGSGQPPVDEVRRNLEVAVAGSEGNTDMYQPSAAGVAAPAPAPAVERERAARERYNAPAPLPTPA